MAGSPSAAQPYRPQARVFVPPAPPETPPTQQLPGVIADAAPPLMPVVQTPPEPLPDATPPMPEPMQPPRTAAAPMEPPRTAAATAENAQPLPAPVAAPAEFAPSPEIDALRREFTAETQALKDRIGVLESQLAASQESLRTMTAALQSSHAELTRMSEEIRYWRSEVHRLDRTTREQHEQDIASLDELSKSLEGLMNSRSDSPGASTELRR